MEIFGKSPVPLWILLSGKISFLGCSFFFLVKITGVTPMLYDAPLTQVAGGVLYAVGLAAVVASSLHLGESLAIGIPEKETELKSDGLYGLSRHPLYMGGFLMCIGSCLFSIHPVNFILMVIAIAVHIRIAKREEEFLEERFGQAWLDYKQRVPRFIGRVGRRVTP